jgi:acyl-coenzyme A synthetase/AMP-(fatty) acid ligase
VLICPAGYPRIFRTGDYAKIVKGSIIFDGRVDSQIKIRGHRVDLTEVEKVIARIPDIDKVVVLCYKPGELTQVNILIYSIRKTKYNYAKIHRKINL